MLPIGSIENISYFRLGFDSRKRDLKKKKKSFLFLWKNEINCLIKYVFAIIVEIACRGRDGDSRGG